MSEKEEYDCWKYLAEKEHMRSVEWLNVLADCVLDLKSRIEKLEKKGE